MQAVMPLIESNGFQRTWNKRKAARAYNLPVETLGRRVASIESLDCRLGPPTVLTGEEEARLAE